MWSSSMKKPFKYSTTFYRKKAILQRYWIANNRSRIATIVGSSTITTTEIQSVFTTSNNVPVQTPIIQTQAQSSDQDIYDCDNVEENYDDGDGVMEYINGAANVEIEQESDDYDENYVLTDGQKREMLRNWLISNRITHQATNEFLYVLSLLIVI